MSILLSILPLLSASLAALAWQWEFDTGPIACQDLTMGIPDTTGGISPYSLLFVPTNPSIHSASVFGLVFPDDLTTRSVKFQLKYPVDTPFVVVGSDGSGFGTGGTSEEYKVVNASLPTNCLSVTAPAFEWSADVVGIGCSTIRISWNVQQVHGQPFFYAVVPSGKSFVLNQPANSTDSKFDWTFSYSSFESVYIIASDDRGVGSGQAISVLVCQDPHLTTAPSISTTTGLSGSSMTSSSPTSFAYSSPMPSSPEIAGALTRHPVNLGIIIGAALGGVVGIVLVVIALTLWRRGKKIQERHLVDLFHDEIDSPIRHSPLPRAYDPSPYMVERSCDLTIPGSATRSSPVQQSAHYRSDSSQSDTYDPSARPLIPSSNWRKVSSSPHILHHEDAGPELETTSLVEHAVVELPPAYTSIKLSDASADASNFDSSERVSGSERGPRKEDLEEGENTRS